MAFVLTGRKPLGLKASPGGSLFSWLPCEKKEWDPGKPTERRRPGNVRGPQKWQSWVMYEGKARKTNLSLEGR